MSEWVGSAEITRIDTGTCDIYRYISTARIVAAAAVPMSSAGGRQSAAKKQVPCGNPFASDGGMEEYIKNLDKVPRAVRDSYFLRMPSSLTELNRRDS